MSSRPQPFTWNDVPRLHALMARQEHGDDRPYRHIGDFYWALRATPHADPIANMWLWARDDASLAAAAWLDGPDAGGIMLAPDADPSFLDEALAFLEERQRAAANPTLSIIASYADRARVDALRSRGYAVGSTGDVRLRRHLRSEPPPAPLPRGFAIHHVATDADIEARAFVERSSFGSAAVTGDLWRLFRERLPTYRPDLDLVAIAPDGTGASACTCWFDSRDRRGEIEAVGTSKDFRQMGIGKAVISEALRRLSGLGATEVGLYTNIGNVASMALYRSCGFDVVAEDHTWTRTL